jgi:hypothetical protein
MGLNLRIYFRSFQKVFFEDNFILLALLQFKKLIDIYSELNGKSKKITESINETKSKFEMTKKVINSGVKQNNPNFINLIR